MEETLKLILGAVTEIKDDISILKEDMGVVKSEVNTLKNQMTEMEYRLSNKINTLYDSQEVLRDDIRRIDKCVARLERLDSDKDLKITALINGQKIKF